MARPSVVQGRRLKRWWLSSLIATAGLVTGGCGAAVGPHQAALTNVTYAGVPASTITLPVFTAEALGYFRAAGLNVHVVGIQSGSAAVDALVSGSVQFTLTTVPQIAALIPQGVHIKIVANSFGLPSNVILCRNSVAMPNANKYPQVMSDFVGKTVGISSFGSLTDQLIRYSMTAAGLNPTSVHEVQLGTSGLIPAMDSGAVDCIVSYEPLTQELLSAGTAKPVLEYWHGVGPALFRHFTSISTGASAAFIAAHPKEVRGFSKAIYEADKVDANPRNAAKLAKLLASDFPGIGFASLKAEIADSAGQIEYFPGREEVSNSQRLGLALGLEKVEEPYTSIVDVSVFASHYVGPGA